MKAVLLMSGGADSVAAWWALDRPQWLHVPCGRDAASGERAAIRWLMDNISGFAEAGEIVDIDLAPFMREGTWEWSRDPLCMFLAWARGYDEVWAAWHLDDCINAERQAESEKTMTDMLCKPEADSFRYRYPLGHLSRRELFVLALEKGAPPEALIASHSCVHLSDQHCGRCYNCAERYLALLGAGVDDTTSYKYKLVTDRALVRKIGCDWYESDYRLGMGLTDDEPIMLEAPDDPRSLDALEQFDVDVVDGKIVHETNGVRLDRFYIGPPDRALSVCVLDEQHAVSLQYLLQMTNDRDDLASLAVDGKIRLYVREAV